MSKGKSRLGLRNWTMLWTLGIIGQICWNIENQWFNSFIYENITKDPAPITWMVAVSAIVTTFATFLFGTLSDRIGKRKPMISIGYILWGVFTVIFGLAGYIPKEGGLLIVAIIMVVLVDAVMSFFGSMGNDGGFNAWSNDIMDDNSRGAIGATLAVQPVIGTIVCTLVGGMIIEQLGYMMFFLIMGSIVALMGVVSIFVIKETNIVANKQGTFWQQFISVFDFKKFFAMKELLWASITVTVFFIGFNIYFPHMGNFFIYTLGISEGNTGVLQGIGLLIAILFSIPVATLINRNKSPLAVIIAVVVNIVGLIMVALFARTATTENPFSVLLILAIMFAGAGYVMLLQTLTVWTKRLYPIDAHGQFEGVRILFFVLFPMVLGPMIADPVIRFLGEKGTNDLGVATYLPTEALFIVAAVVSALCLLPLIKATKYHNNRIKGQSNV